MSWVLRKIPWALAVFATALVVALTLRHRDLRAKIAKHREGDMQLKRGEYVPAFVVTGVDGVTRTIGEVASSDGRQVIFYLTSTCAYCKKTLPAWKAIAQRLDSAVHPNILVAGLTTDSLRVAMVYSRSHALAFPIAPFPGPREVRLSKAATVPQTLVVNRAGRVIFSRMGPIETRAAIDSVINAALKAEIAVPRRLSGSAEISDVPGSGRVDISRE